MYVNWKALCSLGLVLWTLLCATDLLGESAWRRCSSHLDDVLNGQYREMVKMQREKMEASEVLRQKINWPMLMWNVCAFLCSLLFCSLIKSMSWIVWKLFKIYNMFRNRRSNTSRLLSVDAQPNCKVLFKNQMFKKQDQVAEMEELRKEKNELNQQLKMAQKENMTVRQQIEEYKLENFMMKEKLGRTTNTLKENLKYKDFANANQEIIARKAYTLETHLKEVSKERDLLRSKLACMEKKYSKLEDRLKIFDKQETDSNVEQFPEKDVTRDAKEIAELEVSKLEGNTKWEKPTKMGFEANSKISVDCLEDSSRDNDSEVIPEANSDLRKAYISAIKENIMNYSAYKAQMLKPRFKLSNVRTHIYTGTDTGSSSEDNSPSCHRIISSTAEFQNFLKTLTSKSAENLNFDKKFN